MELPQNQIRRVYRARVHGRLNSYKLDRIRQGFDGYKSMKVSVEKRHRRTKLSANTWLQITSTEGQVSQFSLSKLHRMYSLPFVAAVFIHRLKNRQIRNVFQSLGSKYMC